ncbi:MAG: hypothetical protein AB1424_05670 [Thermodesulfobacteriota bacterium]
MKKMLLVLLLCVMGMTAISAGNSDAATPPWYACTIAMVGANSWGYLVTITDTAATPAFTNQTFIVGDPSSNQGKVMIASAMTAFSSGTQVYVLLNSTTAYSTIEALFALQ